MAVLKKAPIAPEAKTQSASANPAPALRPTHAAPSIDWNHALDAAVRYGPAMAAAVVTGVSTLNSVLDIQDKLEKRKEKKAKKKAAMKKAKSKRKPGH